MKTGFARIDITPDNGVLMEGYYEKRAVKGALDRLSASAVAFDDGKKKAVVIGVDVCLLSTNLCNGYKRDIAEALGIEEGGVFINCSHTHTGPVIGNDSGIGHKGDPANDEKFRQSLVIVAKEAFADMKDSSFSVAYGECPGISFQRRYRMKNGGVQTNPGVDNPDILEALGEPNHAVKVLKITRDGSFDLVAVCFGTHADVVGGEYVSADWPGFVRETVEAALPNTKCLFLTGAQGDVNHINTKPTKYDRVGLEYDTFDGVPRSYQHARYMGRKVAGIAIGLVDKCLDIDCEKISYGTLKIDIPSNQDNEKLEEAKKIVDTYYSPRRDELPYEKMELTTVIAEAQRVIELKNGPLSFPFTLSALKIGEFVLAGLPGECFTDIGREIESGTSLEHVFVCCLTNGGDSYFPTSRAYDEGGYEARTSRLKKGGDKILVNGMTKLLAEIEGK